MHGSSLFGRVLIPVCLLAGAGLFAPVVRAQDKMPEDSAVPSSNQAAPVPARAVPGPPDPWRSALPSPSSPSESADVLPPAAAGARPSTVPSKPAAPTGPPAEAGLPGWMSSPPPPNVSGLEWHGNLELDNGYVKYSLQNSTQQPETVQDSRGRFVLGPLLTHDLGNRYFLRLTGQAVAWVREVLDAYQINADDVYVQVGQQGRWDFIVGRFLTWRVFRKGLGFDLYTPEDTAARTDMNYSTKTARYQHMYEVNTIFLRDPSAGPVGRAALHFYPTSWSGIELVGAYGHLDGSVNVLGGRLAGGINPKYVSLLVGAEYQAQSQDQAQLQIDLTPCSKCGTDRTYGFGGSAALAPLKEIEAAFSFAYRKHDAWASAVNGGMHTHDTTLSWGGYLQGDPGSLLMHRSLILGGGGFRTEWRDQDDNYHRHDQLAGYLAYPLGFNNAVVKLVFSRAIGHRQLSNQEVLDGDMYSLRLRFAYYY